MNRIIAILSVCLLSSQWLHAKDGELPTEPYANNTILDSTEAAPIEDESAIEKNPWRFIVAFPMVWMPSINGTIQRDDERLGVSVPFSDILDTLTFGIMADLIIEKGDWSAELRMNQLHSESKSTTQSITGPIWGTVIAPEHKITMKMRLGVNDLVGKYRFHRNFKAYTGIRHIHAKMDLEITPQGSGIVEINENIKITDSNSYDWIVGLEYTHLFTDDWGIAFTGDFSPAGDSDRDYLAQVRFAYKISKLNNIWIGYRYLNIGNDVKDDQGITTKTDFSEQGPMFGWAFTF